MESVCDKMCDVRPFSPAPDLLLVDDVYRAFRGDALARYASARTRHGNA